MKTYKTVRCADDVLDVKTFYLNMNRSNSFDLLKKDLIERSFLTDDEMIEILSRMSEKKVFLLKHKDLQVIKIPKSN